MIPKFEGEGIRWLDFDTEARPLSWFGGDFVTREVTAIACKFIGASQVFCWALGETSLEDMLTRFRNIYDAADGVTGHFIRGYDLPTLNAMMIEIGMDPLPSKLSHDTKLDMLRMSGLSKSQENLGALLDLKHPKVGMNQASWREANRLTPAGIKLTKKRVIGDVRQHEELRRKMLERGMLGPPKVWTAVGSGFSKYAP